ncbi:Uncharacterized protein APZ42_004152 [Daphnia magna]|uniref:Uncharacterized protein n=1 Tax=Daphnia magna TaxID=35525 RepID=A0A164H8J8_9CRUS|nr:Uncharacterized protein APZ42_004152 [Daphnia magna]
MKSSPSYAISAVCSLYHSSWPDNMHTVMPASYDTFIAIALLRY